jgi:hypothetical protein
MSRVEKLFTDDTLDRPCRGMVVALACELKTLCVLQYSDIWSVIVIVTVLKSIARKRIVKTLQRNSHC